MDRDYERREPTCQPAGLPKYTGRGAYTGFADNKNVTENTDPVGPRSTARFLAPHPDGVPERHPRWLPPEGSHLWAPRKRKGTADSYVPWGLIMGDAAGQDPARPNTTTATNLADQSTLLMRNTYGDHITEDHRASRDAALAYMTSNTGNTVAGTLVLDAVSVHDGETERINRTLK